MDFCEPDWSVKDLVAHLNFAGLDPESLSPTGVLWAGESTSPMWFGVAYEYVEKWLHQQQIREATQQANRFDRRQLFPILDIFLRGLPILLAISKQMMAATSLLSNLQSLF